MSAKDLTEQAWKSLATKNKIKDPGLGKALAAYEKCEEEDFAARLEALNEVEKQAKALEKEHAKEKEMAGHLSDVLKEAGKSRKELEALAKEQEGSEAEDEEMAEYKKDLKKKLTSALAQVKARAPGASEPGEEGKPQLQFMAYLASQAPAVIIAKKIGGGTKTLLLSIAEGASGGAYYHGDCIFEEGAHTFVVDKVPGGMAKKLSKALTAATGLKYKVRVRSRDGAVEVDDETEVEQEAAGDGAVAPGGADLEAAFKARLAALVPQLKEALAAGHPAAAELRTRVAEAGNFGKQDRFAEGGVVLDILERLLAEGGAGAEAETAFKERLAALVPRIKEALGSGHPAAAELKAHAAEAGRLGKQDDFTAGHAELVAIEKLLEGKAGGDRDWEGEFKTRFAPLVARVKEAIAAGHPNAEDLRLQMIEVGGLGKLHDFAAACAMLDQIEGGLLEAGESEEEEEEEEITEDEEEEPEPTTNMGIWNQAKDGADSDIDRLCGYLRKTAEPALVEMAERLAPCMGAFKADLTSSLMNFDNASGAQQKAMSPALIALLGKYRAVVLENRFLQGAERNPAVPVNVIEPLSGALDKIRKNVEAALAD